MWAKADAALSDITEPLCVRACVCFPCTNHMSAVLGRNSD